MGVPAFFRWLSRKYPSIVVHCEEEKVKIIDGNRIPVDASKPNPNNFEFDNLYLDMNGIIHPCCHPENRPAPRNEDEMMVLIFEYIDRIFSICRPRKLLYMAIDGVAPRAKMNQQRSRRFRASKEVAEKIESMSEIRERLLANGCYLPSEKPKEEHFDSNCITPGTPFMDRLAKCLHYYIHERLNTDPGWRNIEVVLSDANVPGEGEHKIMDFIRKQRANPEHDPNTRHCLCGADADLIMLGLATHEPSFTIIREEFKPNQPRPCELCSQIGHEMKDCCGAPKEKQGEFDELEKPFAAETDFIFIRLDVLREYLEKDLAMPGCPFPYDFERCIDDWVFMCFFVGNDFLPHLPSLEIREGAIDRLVRLYKSTVYKTGGYLTHNGTVNLSRVQLIMTELGEVEDEIFKRRQNNELNFRARNKAKKKQMKQAEKPAWTPGGQYAPRAIGEKPFPGNTSNIREDGQAMRKEGMRHEHNTDAAQALRAMLKEGKSKDHPHRGGGGGEGGGANNETRGEKRKKEEEEEEDEEPPDEVRLWEDGFKERYYESKFEVSSDNFDFRQTVAAAYTLGLCWVLKYYYQGCASWKWFFPYHYAPFASDFINIGDLPNDFEKGTIPFKPLEQLMGVFPAASNQHLPPAFAELMLDNESPIIDFYPDDFKIDLNGKKFAWQGVALLPFVDEQRLLKALAPVYPSITDEENRRNIRGDDRLYIRKSHPGYDFLLGLYEKNQQSKDVYLLKPENHHGMAGRVLLCKDIVGPDESLESPVSGLETLHQNATVCVLYRDPEYKDDFMYPATRLSGAVEPPRVLKPGDYNSNTNWRPQVGMSRNNQRGYLNQSAYRKLDHSLNEGGGGRNNSQYGNVQPPDFYSRQGGGGRGGGNRRQGGGEIFQAQRPFDSSPGYQGSHQRSWSHPQQQQQQQQQQQHQQQRGYWASGQGQHYPQQQQGAGYQGGQQRGNYDRRGGGDDGQRSGLGFNAPRGFHQQQGGEGGGGGAFNQQPQWRGRGGR